MKKLVFLASGGGGNLKFIYRCITLNFLPNVHVVGVIADRPCGAMEFAHDNDIPSFQIAYTQAQIT